MSQVYTATFSDVAITAAQDLFSLTVAVDRPIRILTCVISQNTDVGDAAEEGLSIKIVRGLGTVGSGGSAPTAIQHDSKGVAADTTVRANDTTEASAGTPVDVHSEVWNVRVPWIYLPVPEARFRADNGDDIVAVQLITVPADSITTSGTITWEEL